MSEDDGATSLEVFQMLLALGHDINACDYCGLNVILTAAHCDGKSPNLPVLDFLLERDDIPRIHKINALELAGAILLSHDENHAKFALAFQYWRRALYLCA